MTIPAPRFDHLLRMSDARGTFEHACFTEPRLEHGYCTDDMARVAVVIAREAHPSPALARLLSLSLRFLVDAQGTHGGSRNRMDREGRWTDSPSFEDCWGRSVWGLGTVAARAPNEATRRSAMVHFARAAQGRSPWLRAMVFAALGAAEVVAVDPGHAVARALLGDAADRIVPSTETTWPWPEPELAYANGAIPEVLIAAGSLLGRPVVLEHGLSLLGWLLAQETFDGHLSVAPLAWRRGSSHRPAFDQQPIEVAALADACARAASIDRDERWPQGVAAAVAWFLGDNDGGHLMWDPATGGAYDGLQEDGPNKNQGTESTLALLSTLQHASRLIAA